MHFHWGARKNFFPEFFNRLNTGTKTSLPMIVHLFNSSSISGPERLVLPALATAREHFVIVNLREERLQHLRQNDPLEEYAKQFKLDYCDIRVCGHWDYVAIRDLRVLLDRLDPDL